MAAAVRDRDDVFPTHPEPVRKKKKPPREPQVYLDIHHFSSGVGSRARRARCAWTSFFLWRAVEIDGMARAAVRRAWAAVVGGWVWGGVGRGCGGGGRRRQQPECYERWNGPGIYVYYILYYIIYIVVVNIHNHKRKEKVGIELRGLLAVHHHHLSKPIGQA